jgi:hypothetical protein
MIKYEGHYNTSSWFGLEGAQRIEALTGGNLAFIPPPE